MSASCTPPQDRMGRRKKTLQEQQETTPVDRKISEHASQESNCESSALSPPKKWNYRQKRSRHLECQEEDIPEKKQCFARAHPIVMLTRVAIESSANTTPHTVERSSDEHSDHTQETNDDKQSDQELLGLSPYEVKRLKNIKENAKFLNSLKLLESASVLRSSPNNRRKTSGIKREKKVKIIEESARRRSTRLQGINNPLTNNTEQSKMPEPVLLEEHPMKPPGPLEMMPINFVEGSGTFENFVKTWDSISQEVTGSSKTTQSADFKRYVSGLKSMSLLDNGVAKVVRDRIFSVAVHPSESQILVAAGDKWGQVGLWNPNHQSHDDGAYAFTPHSRPVCCMYFSPSNSAHLLSLSYDGTVRCGDANRLVFEEIYRDAEDSFSSFDFLSPDASVLLVSHWDAHLSLVDSRTPGTSYEHRTSLGMKSARTVNVHPVNRNICVVAGACDVCIYDVRKLNKKTTQPVLSLIGHTRSVASAYFSPVTGNRILTTCADDLIRVYDSSSLSSVALPFTSLRHNNNTGRWLTRFRAVWDPKQEDCFVIGSMLRPRQIPVFHENGNLLHSFQDSEYLGSVCSINAMHPTRNLLVGGNSSGRLHIFCD
ncbi:WD repeat-containing protein 76 [Pelobates fuscus]|uniref:WD repeat-containing protein 76 n=1 Tax=Pelobates fuscus TaxID=191477 RepID=UPI002FE4D2D8